uniref:Uncharacterized protein n=1 Tax=Panagrolaimus sp. PS1159 TaxID=55785 RepID=A0AC35F6W3_9BILA
MDNERCCILNNKYRDVRLDIDMKLKELQNFISLTDEYECLHPESDLSELKIPHTVEDVKKFISGFDEYDPKKRYAFIRGSDGKYISSQNGERPMNLIERPVPLGWEVFCVEEWEGKIALKSRGKYVSSENGENEMRCDRENIGEMEKFLMIQHGDAYVFQGNNGKLVSCSAEDNSLTCTCENDIIGLSEIFHIEWISDFADEVNISWKHYDNYFTKIYEDYNNAFEGKKKINPENYYFNSEIEVYHHGGGNAYFTYHQQKIFNQKEFKEAMQKADQKLNNLQMIIRDQNSFLNGILWREKSDLEKVTKMLNTLVPFIALLGGKTFIEVPIESSSNYGEDDDFDEE